MPVARVSHAAPRERLPSWSSVIPIASSPAKNSFTSPTLHVDVFTAPAVAATPSAAAQRIAFAHVP
jgi:hypothetical protein